METFSYEGRIYVRPIGRGICLVDADGPQLEERLDEGYWHVTISARRLTANEAKAAEQDFTS